MAPMFSETVLMSEHSGTHCDAPAHFMRPDEPLGDVTAEQLDLGRLIGSACVIDVSSLRESREAAVSPRITPALIEAWEIRYGRMGADDIVLFRSDWSDLYGENQAQWDAFYGGYFSNDLPGWPAPSVETLRLLHARGVTTVGTDSPSMGSRDDSASAHRFGLGVGMIFVELLSHLRALPPRGSTFIFLPLKIKGGSGAPGRAIALLDGEDLSRAAPSAV